MTTSTRPTYETDFAAWAFSQADLLRQEHFDALDLENLIEELETLGRSEYRAFESALTRLTQHLLKWQYQADKRSKSWLSTIREQRRQIAKLLRDNPSFKARLAEAIAEGYSDGRGDAAFETDLPLASFPEQCPYSWEQLVNQDWLPEG
jgi:hypothetical protein